MPEIGAPRFAPPNKIKLYHITSWHNLEGMLREGGLWCSRELEERGIERVNAAHDHIRERRASKEIRLPPGGTLADYIPWSFGYRQPMLCSLAHIRVNDQQVRQRDMVHLITSMPAVEASNLQWLFSDGHPLVLPSGFFNSAADLNRIDWPLMGETWWNNTDDDMGRTRRRQAEFLIHRFVPWPMIKGIGTKTEEVAASVRILLDGLETPVPVKCKPEWYF